MADIAALVPFVATSFLIEVTPGPNLAYLAVIAATELRRAGYAAVAGVALGLAVVGTAAAFGLAALIDARPIVYQVLRWGGVGYLLWLAWDGWRGGGEATEHAEAGSSYGRFFRRGLVTNLLNPKAAVFYLMVLPGFLAPGAGRAAVMLLSAVYVGVATLVHGGIVTAAGAARAWVGEGHRALVVRRILALALVGVAGWMIWKT